MSEKRWLISVLLIACLYIAVGAVGFVVHFKELLAGHPDAWAIEGTELLAVVIGALPPATAELGAVAGAGLDFISCSDQHRRTGAAAGDALPRLRADRVGAVPASGGTVVLEKQLLAPSY